MDRHKPSSSEVLSPNRQIIPQDGESPLRARERRYFALVFCTGILPQEYFLMYKTPELMCKWHLSLIPLNDVSSISSSQLSGVGSLESNSLWARFRWRRNSCQHRPDSFSDSRPHSHLADGVTSAPSSKARPGSLIYREFWTSEDKSK